MSTTVSADATASAVRTAPAETSVSKWQRVRRRRPAASACGRRSIQQPADSRARGTGSRRGPDCCPWLPLGASGPKKPPPQPRELARL
jgi:hypothetical protein